MRTAILTGGIGMVGGVGAVARYWLHNAIVQIDPRDFPLGTFVVNVLGTFLLGLLIGANLSDDLQLLLGTGLLGAFTTFSTWMFETERLSTAGTTRGAITNLILSITTGAIALQAGLHLT